MALCFGCGPYLTSLCHIQIWGFVYCFVALVLWLLSVCGCGLSYMVCFHAVGVCIYYRKALK